MKIIVLGKSGQLAQELRLISNDRDIIFFGRPSIDIANFNKLREKIISSNPDVIINTAAYTNVENAEDEQDNAFLINYKAVQNIAEICGNYEIKLVHISTDFVFDGTKRKPYDINDKPNPLNVYGLSKLHGENSIFKKMDKGFTIIRTSWLYSEFGNNFVKKIIELMQTQDVIKVVNDQIGSPTYALGLAEHILQIIDNNQFDGLNHWSDMGEVSWFEFASAILKHAKKMGLIDRKVEIIPVSSSDYETKAKRPQYSSLKLNSGSAVDWELNLKLMLSNLKTKLH